MAAIKITKEFISSIPKQQFLDIDEAPRMELSLLTNHSLLDQIAIQLTNELFGTKKKKALNLPCIKLIIENLIRFSAFEYLGIFLNAEPYRDTSWDNFPVNETRMGTCIRVLELYQYVDLFIGQQNTGYTSRIKPKTKLKLLLKQLMNIDLTHKEENLLVMKNQKTFWDKAERIPYEHTEQTLIWLENLNCINAEFKNHKFMYIDENNKTIKLNPRLRRVFSHSSWELGGRFYDHSFQKISEDDRLRISIDRQTVVEWDFSGTHPNLLYVECTKALCPFDPYTLKENFNLSSKDRRDAAKLVFQMMLNCKRRDKALIASIKYLAEEGYKVNAEELLLALERLHAPILHKFYQGVGLRLQHCDSMIAEKVLLAASEAEIGCLPVHDSMIVPSEHSEWLRKAMEQACIEVIGVALKIK